MNLASRGNFNEPGQVQVVVIIFRDSRWCDDTTWNTVTVGANIFVDIHTTVSAIIIAVSIVGLVITDAISNFRKGKPKGTVFLMITNTISAVILVDVDTAISTIVEATGFIRLIIADPISNQWDISSTIWNIDAIQGVLTLCKFHLWEFHYCDFLKHSINASFGQFIQLVQFFEQNIYWVNAICLMLILGDLFHYCEYLANKKFG